MQPTRRELFRPSCELLGEHPVFLKCLEVARRAARTDASVLITGESGTGKEGVARLVHAASGRADGPFVPVHCGAIPESLVESELFGHVRGAYTGAHADRTGKFALAHGGTLFLDEIGEMPLTAQSRLLRALQERVVEPVGGSAPVRADFRLVAATHRDLPAEVRAGRFREDVLFRLHVVPVELPPLRARGRDVLILARHYLARFNARHGAACVLAREDEERLLAHSWPGNVRELVNVLERAVVLSEGPALAIRLGAPEDVTGRESIRAADRARVLTMLEETRWNKTLAAARLGISRRGLLYKLKAYGIQ